MPFTGTIFTYTNPSGALNAQPGDIVQSAVWNQINTDVSGALTQVYSQLVSDITNRNILAANGSFDIWQLGAGGSSSIAIAASTTQYTADRWYITTGLNQVSVVSAQSSLSNNSLKSVRIQRTAAQTGTTVITFGYPLDTPDIARLLGNRVSLGFLAQAGANFSPASGTLTCALYAGTGAVAKRGGGFTNETTVLSISTNMTPGGAITAIAGSSSGIVPTNTTQAELQFTWTPAGVAGAADYIQFDDVELDCQLSDATWAPMDYDRIPFEEQLQLCKRFYQKTLPYSVAPNTTGASGFPGALVSLVQVAATRVALYWQYPVELRATGSVATYNCAATGANWINTSVSVSVVVSQDTALGQSPKGIYIYSANTSSPAAGTNMYIQGVVDANI